MTENELKLVSNPLPRRDPDATSPEDREKENRGRRIGFATVLALLVSGIVTFLILTGQTPIHPNREVVIYATIVNGFLAIVLFYLIIHEVLRLMRYRRRGRAAARLHIRIIGMFSLAAALPAVLVAIVAGITLDQGLDRWFEGRTKSIVESSISIARAYMNESTRVLVGNTISMASDLDANQAMFRLDRSGFRNLMTLHARGRGFIGAWLVDKDRKILVSAQIPTERKLPMVHADAIREAESGDPVQIPPSGTTNLVGAVFKLRKIPNTYLYTIIPVQPAVLNALNETVINSAQYQGLEQNRIPFQLAYAILYTSVVLIVLLAAIWTGISVADRFVAPIRRLIGAADEVRSGNLNVAVTTRHAEGDLRNLSDTFNVMISELRNQQGELIKAHDVMDRRAQFTEAVLSGVSAGVLGVDQDGRISIANRVAIPLLGLPEDINETRPTLHEVAPVVAVVFANAALARSESHHEQVSMMVEGRERTLNISVTREQVDESHNHSFVISVDDITDLVSAQRNTAWADIARRIAHEIKNPLTPIQLSAERIRRRYGKKIGEDREVFDQCIDTIVRQVGDIGSMVDEFSTFARMPKPSMSVADMRPTLRETVFMQMVGHPEVTYTSDLGEEKLIARFDARLISQALINVMKNAAEAIEGHEFSEGEKPMIHLRAYRQGERICIEITDNGKGLPATNRQRLLEPYMTTREKGTGLGLAIVRKVVEDHEGGIELLDSPEVASGGHGAMMRLVLPVAEAAIDDSENTENPNNKSEPNTALKDLTEEAVMAENTE